MARRALNLALASACLESGARIFEMTLLRMPLSCAGAAGELGVGDPALCADTGLDGLLVPFAPNFFVSACRDINVQKRPQIAICVTWRDRRVRCARCSAGVACTARASAASRETCAMEERCRGARESLLRNPTAAFFPLDPVPAIVAAMCEAAACRLPILTLCAPPTERPGTAAVLCVAMGGGWRSSSASRVGAEPSLAAVARGSAATRRAPSGELLGLAAGDAGVITRSWPVVLASAAWLGAPV